MIGNLFIALLLFISPAASEEDKCLDKQPPAHIQDGDRIDSLWDLNSFPYGLTFPPRHPLNLYSNLNLANWPSQQQLGMDLTEESDKWVVHADLPGFNEEDVELSVQDGMLAVTAKREKKFESDVGKAHRTERSFGEVRRVMRLPKGADSDNSNAQLQNGVLTINFPKLKSLSEGRKIPFVEA